mmetsp:Transcript_33237/g.83877  ORF Transcript_33237/g.83877 Transcript_33237/m.83877 type:complete len:201 (-) Transcript_33237:57-659(-)
MMLLVTFCSPPNSSCLAPPPCAACLSLSNVRPDTPWSACCTSCLRLARISLGVTPLLGEGAFATTWLSSAGGDSAGPGGLLTAGDGCAEGGLLGLCGLGSSPPLALSLSRSWSGALSEGAERVEDSDTDEPASSLSPLAASGEAIARIADIIIASPARRSGTRGPVPEVAHPLQVYGALVPEAGLLLLRGSRPSVSWTHG